MKKGDVIIIIILIIFLLCSALYLMSKHSHKTEMINTMQKTAEQLYFYHSPPYTYNVFNDIHMLKVIEDGHGACGNYAGVLRYHLKKKDYQTRFVTLYIEDGVGHTMLEVYYDNEWHLLDPSFDTYWENQDGTIASMVDIMTTGAINNPKHVITQQQREEKYSNIPPEHIDLTKEYWSSREYLTIDYLRRTQEIWYQYPNRYQRVKIGAENGTKPSKDMYPQLLLNSIVYTFDEFVEMDSKRS